MSRQITMPDVAEESAPSYEEISDAASPEVIPISFVARWSSQALFTYFFIWKYAFAMVCTQNPLLSVLLVGWSHRFTQRAVFKRWWKLGGRDSTTFNAFIASIEQAESHVARPNWIVQHHFRANLRRSWTEKQGCLNTVASTLRALFHSLCLNAKLGVQVMFNIWVLTLPGCVLMLFAWEYGWNNSFYKGYEQAQIGPATGLLGIALFIIAMMYVPMATAQQAATEKWKAFYEFRFVSRLIRRRPFRCLGLAVAFALLAMPVNLLKATPAFMTGGGGEFAQRVEAMTAGEARAFLNS